MCLCFFLFSETGDCSLVAGLSVTLTFLVTVILFCVIALLVAMFVHLQGRKREIHVAPPITLYDTPFPVDSEEETKKVD